MLEIQWRDDKKAVIRLAKKHWGATPVKKLLVQLKRFHRSFSKTTVPLIKYIGVYATRNIRLNETILGLD
jgi:hypothetical protein